MKPKEIPLEEGQYYHIYNRGNNRERIFFSEENYHFFMRRYREYLSEYIDTYAYSLLPNHFHLLVRVKERVKDAMLFEKALRPETAGTQFHRLFTSYAKAINKQRNRVGSLFQGPFKRIQINSTEYLTNLIYYIHANPQTHGYTVNFRNYTWSSYSYLANGTSEKQEEIMDWFGTELGFLEFHKNKEYFNGLISLED